MRPIDADKLIRTMRSKLRPTTFAVMRMFVESAPTISQEDMDRHQSKTEEQGNKEKDDDGI